MKKDTINVLRKHVEKDLPTELWDIVDRLVRKDWIWRQIQTLNPRGFCFESASQDATKYFGIPVPIYDSAGWRRYYSIHSTGAYGHRGVYGPAVTVFNVLWPIELSNQRIEDLVDFKLS
jgi:hypothetical protein